MSVPTIQAQYDSLEEIAKRFDQQASDIEKMARHLIQMLEQLERGGWEGDAAQAFFREMNDEVLPTTNNLRDAFTESSVTTQEIVRVMQTAEQEAANQFQINQINQINKAGGNASSNNIPVFATQPQSTNSGGGSGGSTGNNPAPSSNLVVQDPSQTFSEPYMDSMVGHHQQGEDTLELNDKMEQLLSVDPSDTARVDQLLGEVAVIRGVDEQQFKQDYEVYQQLLTNQGGIKSDDTIDITRHGDFLGSTASMRFGKVVGDTFGIDPVFGSLLNPTGGMVGSGNDAYNPGDNDAVGYHGIFHDAAGFLWNKHDKLGSGYDYIGNDPWSTDPTDPLAGQISGIYEWVTKYPELTIDTSQMNEMFDIPYVPESVESGLMYVVDKTPLDEVIQAGMAIVDGGTDVVHGVGQILDGQFIDGASQIVEGIGNAVVGTGAAIIEAGGDVVDVIADTGGAIAGGIGSALDTIGGWLGL